MNTLFRNFSHTFRRFFTASVLNLLGLSIAFAACFVILTQVDYDYNYKRQKMLRAEEPSNRRVAISLAR
jgi:putative ABC transport system permease protein